MCERDQLAFWTKLLNLDGFQVVHEATTTSDEPRCFTVIPTTPLVFAPTSTHLCHGFASFFLRRAV